MGNSGADGKRVWTVEKDGELMRVIAQVIRGSMKPELAFNTIQTLAPGLATRILIAVSHEDKTASAQEAARVVLHNAGYDVPTRQETAAAKEASTFFVYLTTLGISFLKNAKRFQKCLRI